MQHPSIPASLSSLASIPQDFLDPNAGFVVMSETGEQYLSEALLAMKGFASMLECLGDANVKLRNQGLGQQRAEMDPVELAALIRVMCDRIEPQTNNPTLNMMRRVRPDLFGEV